MHRTALIVTTLVTCTTAAQADLQLVVDTDSQTLFFQGTYTEDAAPIADSFRMRWTLTPPGPDTTATVGETFPIAPALTVSQSIPSAALTGPNLLLFSNDAGPDVMLLDLLWSFDDPGTVTLTPGSPISYAGLNADAQSILERSIGSTLLSTSTFGGAPGIPVVPAPGALALLCVGGCVATRRRRV
ncbi:MAG: hypothetical protein Tsb0013_16630 [Phycisphaerales bacterium]